MTSSPQILVAKQSMKSRPPRRYSSADIASDLRKQIVRGDWAYRDRLPSGRTLSETYGVARATIREALNQIAAEALIEIRPGSGAYVVYKQAPLENPAVAAATPLELIDARFALEPHICRLAVLHARQDELARLKTTLRTMARCLDDPAGFSDADTAFHVALAQLTHNDLICALVETVDAVRHGDDWAEMRSVTLDRDMIKMYYRQHEAIYKAICSRNPDQAANAMKSHLETARLSLTRATAT
ncbi:MAG: FadR/GntR family transcriptional regulator [Pseudomonadota bacterium]